MIDKKDRTRVKSEAEVLAKTLNRLPNIRVRLPGTKEAVERYDKNKDGALDGKEIRKSPFDRVFEYADRNHDKILDRGEIERVVAQVNAMVTQRDQGLRPGAGADDPVQGLGQERRRPAGSEGVDRAEEPVQADGPQPRRRGHPGRSPALQAGLRGHELPGAVRSQRRQPRHQGRVRRAPAPPSTAPTATATAPSPDATANREILQSILPRETSVSRGRMLCNTYWVKTLRARSTVRQGRRPRW